MSVSPGAEVGGEERVWNCGLVGSHRSLRGASKQKDSGSNCYGRFPILNYINYFPGVPNVTSVLN